MGVKVEDKRDLSHIRVGEDMIWPNIGVRLNDLEWNLRHNKAYTPTRGDRLHLASVCSAYRALIDKTNPDQRYKKAMEAVGSSGPSNHSGKGAGTCLASYVRRVGVYKELWADDNLGKALCSECAPTHFKSGYPVTYSAYGKWHGKFEKRIPTKEEIESWDLLK
jgi:hypothetical protein